MFPNLLWNPLLYSFPGLEPVVLGHSVTRRCLLDLLKDFKFTLPEDHKCTREIWIQIYQNLPKEFA